MMRPSLPLVTALALALPSAQALASPPSPADHSPVATATQLGLAFSHVAETVSPSVVAIRVEVTEEPPGLSFFYPFEQERPLRVRQGSGSGIVLGADGAILTNNHVIENAIRIEVALQDGRKLPARVAGTDPATDLAVLKVAAKDLPAARFADSDAAEVGQWVVAIGSPFGLDYTVTAGVLSAKGRGGLGANEIEDYLQTDASINPGNSGGPLVNLMGEVIGINTMIIGRASGIGFAIPSNLARRVAGELLEGGEVHRAWIGVSYQDLTPELAQSFGVSGTRGALINDVVEGGPAARAGLLPGDVVLEIEGRRLDDGRDLLRAVVMHPVGAKLAVQVTRRGQRKELSLVTGERPHAGRSPAPTLRPVRAQEEPRGLGVELLALTPRIARRLGYDGPGKIVVRQVAAGSIAARVGMSSGDIIEAINHEPVSSPEQALRELSRGRALLRLWRGGMAFFTVAP